MTAVNFDAPAVNFDDIDVNFDGYTIVDVIPPGHLTHAKYHERHNAEYRERRTVHAYED